MEVTQGFRLYTVLHGKLEDVKLPIYSGKNESMIRWHYICHYFPKITSVLSLSTSIMRYFRGETTGTCCMIKVAVREGVLSPDDAYDYAILRPIEVRINLMSIPGLASRLYKTIDVNSFLDNYSYNLPYYHKDYYMECTKRYFVDMLIPVIIQEGDREIFTKYYSKFGNEGIRCLFVAGISKPEVLDWINFDIHMLRVMIEISDGTDFRSIIPKVFEIALGSTTFTQYEIYDPYWTKPQKMRFYEFLLATGKFEYNYFTELYEKTQCSALKKWLEMTDV